ncbi:MAG: hypothetical protein IJ191_04845 [Treponema sp.]|nr:hypothetical protein [Treponema sp.]
MNRTIRRAQESHLLTAAALVRHPDSYTTYSGQNKHNRGKDTLTVTNNITNESISVPVSSVANMVGKGAKDTLSEEDFTLTYDPATVSKYAPDVLTISSGMLMPTIPSVRGESIRSDGTTVSHPIRWAVHIERNTLSV